MGASDVGVVIVSYGTREKTLRCLSRIPPGVETVVVDNGSTDGSPEAIREAFPGVRLIEAGENLGFGRANNRGEATLSTPLVLYLNSDAYLEPGSLDTLAAAFDDPAVVAAGGHLRNPDGSFQPCAARRLTLWAVFCEQLYLERIFRSYWLLEMAGEPVAVDQCMGAALMVRRGLERFDERFFLYCEDTDLCLRLSRHGRIVHVPSARVIHELGSSSSRDRWRSVVRYNRGKELYFRLHHGPFPAFLCLLLNRKGAALRLLAGLLLFRRGKAATFARVLFAPLHG